MNLMEIPGLLGFLIFVVVVLWNTTLVLVSLWIFLVALRLLYLRRKTLAALDIQIFALCLSNVVLTWSWGWLKIIALIVSLVLLVICTISFLRRKALAMSKGEPRDYLDASNTNSYH